MASSLSLATVWRLVLLFAGGAAALAAERAGLWASFVIAVLVAVWAAVGLMQAARRRSEAEAGSERSWLAAMHEREREARSLAAFLDHAPVPLLTADRGGTLTALNLAGRKFFATDDIVVDPPAALREAVLEVAPGERRTVILESEGSPRAYALTVSDLTSEAGMVRIVALVDIQAEIQAAEATALRELIQVLSHEIMNSLTPVTSLARTAADLLAEAEPGPRTVAQAREAAEGVARRSEGLLRFIEAYRTLARLPPPAVSEVSVAALLEETALLFRSRWEPEGVRLELEAPPDVIAALDRDLMVQALLNVLANAAEAALEGGQDPSVRLAAHRTAKGRLVISVEDNGPGFDIPDPAQAFRPFYTTKPAGAGVGLSLVRQVVLAHGGDVAAATRPAGGAVVTLTL